MKQVSTKQVARLRELKKLTDLLKIKAGFCSELSGVLCLPFLLEPHHIKGRVGKLLLDSFNIIILTRPEHSRAQGTIGQVATPSKDELLAIVRPIRIKQGFEERI